MFRPRFRSETRFESTFKFIPRSKTIFISDPHFILDSDQKPYLDPDSDPNSYSNPHLNLYLDPKLRSDPDSDLISDSNPQLNLDPDPKLYSDPISGQDWDPESGPNRDSIRSRSFH